ncbi:MAG TPA: adenosine-specific kinase [Bacteroidota bacterium]|nr:adenosine-specific kinase [Bacteroidota bacterium]
MNLSAIPVEKPADMNFMLGHAHFIKTVEDLYEAVVQTNPAMKFGIAFCEASGPALVRSAGNDRSLIALAEKNAMAIGAGHSFLIFMQGGFPVNILNAVKSVTEVCTVYCATANPTEVIVAETELGRGILGVVDGVRAKGVETPADVKVRREFLRTIGYKL